MGAMLTARAMKRVALVLLACACSSTGGASDAGPDAADGGAAIDGSLDAVGDAPADAGAEAAPPIVPTPFSCPANAPEAVFVSEVAPPATMTPRQHVNVSVTYANCGTQTWSATKAPPDGIKLGPSGPHDLATWSLGRIALPADVPPSYAIEIPIELHAPPLTGTHAYSFELVRDGVAWLGQPSPTHTIDVEAAPASAVAICTGQSADPSGQTDARAALQACIAATPSGGTLALPPGIYRLSGVLTIDHPMTLTTSGTTGAAGCLDWATVPCAVFRADASAAPNGQRGFFRLGTLATQVSQVTLDHVVVDGDRAARLGSAMATACAQGNTARASTSAPTARIARSRTPARRAPSAAPAWSGTATAST